MNAKDGFNKMFLLLEMHDVYATKQFEKDICSLVKTDVQKFIKDFTRDFSRNSLKEYKKYERLKLTPNQNKELDGNALFRYEYRNSSNLRCIYMMIDENNSNKTFLLNAFNEDNSKSGGKNSYNFNIERAIKTYQSIKLKGRG